MATNQCTTDSEQKPAKFSLARLSTAFAKLMGPHATTGDSPAESKSLRVTATMIVEGMLFVGASDEAGLTAEAISQHIRDVEAEDVERMVDELNHTYRDEGAAWEIVRDGGTLRLQLRPEFGPLVDRLRGRDGALKLSPAAIEVLSIVAYRPGATADQINRLRGARSNQLLAKLVRWRMLRVDRPEGSPRTKSFHATERFTRLLGIAAISDLPQPNVLDDLASNETSGKPAT